MQSAATVDAMTRSDAQPITVEVQAWQQGSHIILDWRVYRSTLNGSVRRQKRHRRVMIRHDKPLSEVQLTGLVSRMVAYINAGGRGTEYVPKHLPWMEVGATEWSVPPGGGEGGEKPHGQQS